MQRELKLEKYVVYPAKADRYPGGDRYEGGPLAPHHAVAAQKLASREVKALVELREQLLARDRPV